MYIIAATGGLETPSFKSETELDAALNVFVQWETDLLGDPGNRVDLLEVTDTGVNVIKSVSWGENDDPFSGV